MISDILSLRWLHCAGYEIRLPCGKTIVTDPFLTTQDFGGFTWENIEGADYILVTHTHGDHTSDVGNLVEKFRSQVVVGQMSCNSLVEYFDLNYSTIWPVLPGQQIDFGDFVLHVYPGKHTEKWREDYRPSQAYQIPGIGGSEGSYRDGNHFGGMEFLNFGITTQEGLRILVAGGLPDDRNLYRETWNFRPNILIRQVNARSTPAEYAAITAPYGAQFVFPHHHEKIPTQTGISIEEYCRQVNQEYQKIGIRARMVYPEKFHWVDLKMAAELR